jgi:hypothetical protein
MYFTDRGIEELADRRGEEQVTVAWLAERLRDFVDLNPDFETAVDRLATWLARLDDDEDLLSERTVVRAARTTPAGAGAPGSTGLMLHRAGSAAASRHGGATPMEHWCRHSNSNVPSVRCGQRVREALRAGCGAGSGAGAAAWMVGGRVWDQVLEGKLVSRYVLTLGGCDISLGVMAKRMGRTGGWRTGPSRLR